MGKKCGETTKSVITAGVVLLFIATAWQVFAQDPRGAQGGPGLQVKVANAKPGDVRLIVSAGLRAPLESVKVQAEKAVGHPFVIEYGPSQGLKATIASGQPFELTIVTPEVLDEMIASDKIVAGSRYDVAHVPVAIGQRGDAPKSDISTPEALKETMLHAKSILWAANGASLPAINKMLDALSIRETTNARVNMPGGPIQLAPGEYELNINLASEILPLKNYVYLGNFPKEFDVPAIMAAGIGSSGDEKSARALIKFLQGPAIEASLKENGMQR